MAKHRAYFIITFILNLVLAGGLSAQSELALYRFGQSVPQAGAVNPSFIPDYKVVIGLPLLSNYVHADNDGISFKDIFFRDGNDSLQLDRQGLPPKLSGTRKFSINTQNQLFYYGFRALRFYFTIGANLNLQMRMTYPGELAGWAIVGPADPLYADTDLRLSDFSVDALAYQEYYGGVAREFGPLSLGVRARYLIGLGAARSNEVKGSLHVGIDSVSIHTSPITLNTAGYTFFQQDNLGVSDYAHYAFGSKNKGLALDLGASFKVNDHISVSAALNDIGYLHWREYTKRYDIQKVDYTFKGFDVVDYLNNNSTSGIEAEVDTIKAKFNSSETEGAAFTTTLVPKLYASVNYKLGKLHEFGLVGYADLNRGNILPAVGLSYSLRLGRMVQAVIGGSYSNGRLNNVGAGLSVRLGPLQVYTVSDRANGLLYPSRTSWGNIRGGVNLVFGHVKEKERKPKTPSDTTAAAPTDTTHIQPVREVPQDTVHEVKPDTVAQVPPAQEQVVTPVNPVAATPDTTQVPAVDTTIVKVDTTAAITPDTIRAAPVAEPVQVEPTMEPVAREVVKRGTSRDELPVGNYVIVGVFKSKQNAAAYSARLQAANFYNTFGYVSEKNAYYVQVYYSKDDLQAVRKARDDFRKMNRFQFKDAWVLTIKE